MVPNLMPYIWEMKYSENVTVTEQTATEKYVLFPINNVALPYKTKTPRCFVACLRKKENSAFSHLLSKMMESTLEGQCGGSISNMV